jgi:hypothetical protein
MRQRLEGPPVARPGRQAGIWLILVLSTEGAALSIKDIIKCRAFSAQISLLTNPDLAVGPSHCRPFGPKD